jgi:hypothetical protein
MTCIRLETRPSRPKPVRALMRHRHRTRERVPEGPGPAEGAHLIRRCAAFCGSAHLGKPRGFLRRCAAYAKMRTKSAPLRGRVRRGRRGDLRFQTFFQKSWRRSRPVFGLIDDRRSRTTTENGRPIMARFLSSHTMPPGALARKVPARRSWSFCPTRASVICRRLSSSTLKRKASLVCGSREIVCHPTTS